MPIADENAEVLEGIAARGTDLSTPRLVDFAHLFFSEVQADSFKNAAEVAGYKVSIAGDDEEGIWDVVASSEIMPSVEEVTRIEQKLGSLARSFGGHSDGWGFLES
jgi:hypothetical protein